MQKPPNMTDEEWGEFLADCAMGSLGGPPPAAGFWIITAVIVLGVLIGFLMR